ncbi:hypothetical protein PL373_16200 [Tenacibaculum maritimum]|nr:hypothetical protein [Tenacibaculum maritimum]MDB0602644.1 hypothetical protein [Tenacibaculum maritimum]MDB0611245.1 hypothetical protein [Tenacibaculum maritimum]
MSLNKGRLKGKIIEVLEECQKETTNPNDSKNLLAERLSSAIIEEIKQIKINYQGGLSSPSGAVTGSLIITIS